MSAPTYVIALTVNGEGMEASVEARKNLVDFLREDLGLTGSHVGCEHGVCGACTVRVDGVVVRGCLMLAAQCDGARVETIEGVSDAGEVADLQAAFEKRNALQCGYCTPGMLLTAQELLKNGRADREAIREHLSGNYCRCTGYEAIVDAVLFDHRQQRRLDRVIDGRMQTRVLSAALATRWCPPAPASILWYRRDLNEESGCASTLADDYRKVGEIGVGVPAWSAARGVGVLP